MGKLTLAGLQVVLQDQTSGARLPVEPSSVEASSSDASDAHALGNGHGAPGNGVPVSTSSSTAALRVYYEYLSFIFRRPAGASAQEQAELAYRDHLQAGLLPLCGMQGQSIGPAASGPMRPVHRSRLTWPAADTCKPECTVLWKIVGCRAEGEPGPRIQARQVDSWLALRGACLQVPLQPLKDNLESQTYEVFEKDETKYTSYEAAIRQALVERHASGQKAETSATDSTDGASRSAGPVVHIMVVGAGRGPLVRASLAAGEKSMCDCVTRCFLHKHLMCFWSCCPLPLATVSRVQCDVWP